MVIFSHLLDHGYVFSAGGEKYVKTFSDVFRGYRKATPGCNELRALD